MRFTTVFCLSVATGCAGATHAGHTVETVGGARRVRQFASATAYEAFVRAEIARAHADDPTAVRQYALARFAAEDDVRLAIATARGLARAGSLAEARTLVEAVVRAHPDDADAHAARAEVLLAAGDAHGARDAAMRAAALAPDDPDVRALVATVNGGDGAQVADARASAPAANTGDRTDARRAHAGTDGDGDESPRLARVRDARARSAYTRGDWAGVERALGPLVADDVATVDERRVLFTARLRDGRPDDAARLVGAVPVAPVPGGIGLGERAALWLACGRYDTAADEAGRALTVHPDDATARFVLGASLVEGADVARGLALLAAVLPGDHRFVDARVRAARALARNGRVALAIRVIEHAIELLPSDAVSERGVLDAERLHLVR